MVDLQIQLPEHFLDEEERCGYTVSSEMKKVWAVQLDLLVAFDKVCKKHHITYFASSGTMLGAVRHKGFIPWDDDIDVMMLRSEYEKLCKVAVHEFKQPYFFQTEQTDPTSARRHAQLRNSLTTAILKSELKKKYHFNQGIFIDIFPLDAIADDDRRFERQAKKSMRIKQKYRCLMNLTDRYTPSKDKNIKEFLRAAAHKAMSGPFSRFISYKPYYQAFEDSFLTWEGENTKMLGLLCLRFEKRNLRFREDFQEAIEMPFEFIKIPVPKNYDHALTHIYGDYMKFVPGMGQVHSGVVYDADIPYNEYFEQHKNCE